MLTKKTKKIDKIDDILKEKRDFWKRFPKFKKSGLAWLTHEIISQSEPDDYAFLCAAWLARRFKVSESYLSRCFSDYFKKPLKQFITKHRMDLAEKLLVKFHWQSIDKIAKRLHYCDGNYFIRIFKKVYKMTPYQYRKKILKEKKDFANVKEYLSILRDIYNIRISRWTEDLLKMFYLNIKKKGVKDNDLKLSVVKEDDETCIALSTKESCTKFSCYYPVPLHYDNCW